MSDQPRVRIDSRPSVATSGNGASAGGLMARGSSPKPLGNISGDDKLLRLDINAVGRCTTSAWSSPPAVLARLLQEVFSAQPEDVLTWLHVAVWRHRTEELSTNGHCSQALSDGISQPPSCGSIPRERPSREEAEDITDVLETSNQSERHVCWLLSSEGTASVQNEGTVKYGGTLRPTSEDVHEDSPIAPHAARSPNVFWIDKSAKAELNLENISSAHDSKTPDLLEVWCGVDSTRSSTSPPNATRGSATASSLAWSTHPTNAYRIHANPTANYQVHASSTVDSAAGMPRIESGELQAGLDFPYRGSTTTESGVHSQGTQLTHLGSWLEHFTTRKQESIVYKSASSLQEIGDGDLLFIERRSTIQFEDPCVMSPVSLVRFIWELLFFLCLVFEIWATPFEIILLPEDALAPEWLRVAAIVVLGIFCLDIVLNFFTGFVEDGRIIMTRRRIFHNYFFGWFWIDLLVTLPAVVLDHYLSFSRLSLLRASKVFRLVRMMKALKLLRVIRLVRTQRLAYCIMHHFGYSSRVKTCWYLAALLVLFLMAAHLHAIIWAASQPAAWKADTVNEAYMRYLTAFYWSSETLACGGSALPLESGFQEVLMIIVSAERVCAVPVLLAWAVWRIMVQRFEGAEVAAVQEGALAYLKRHRVPIEVQLQVFRNLQETGEVQNLQRQFDKLSKEKFPANLRQTICDELWAERLMSIGLVQELAYWSAYFLKELVLVVREEVFASKVIVFSHEELSTAAYLVLRGSLMVACNELKGSSKADYTIGMWAGEKALVNMSLRRSETVVCRVRSELMKIFAKDFHELVSGMGLMDQFQELLRKKLWLGLCGRCGTLGDHFPSDCPRNQDERMSRKWFPFTRRFNGSFQGALTGRSSVLSADMLRFLAKHNLLHLQATMERYGVLNLDDLRLTTVRKICDDPLVKLTEAEAQVLSDASIRDFKRKLDKANTVILANQEDHHLMFISHYKVEAGTEAALITEDLDRLIKEDPGSPGHSLKAPVFLDTENLKDLSELKSHVRRSHNLVLLLTCDVLTRPWVLIEIVTAMKDGVPVVPVEIQRPGMAFKYPDEDYYQRLLDGKILDKGAEGMLRSEGISLRQLEQAIRQVFTKIAVPFSPHKTANIRQAELLDLLVNCRERNVFTNGHRRHPRASNGRERGLRGSRRSLASNANGGSIFVSSEAQHPLQTPKSVGTSHERSSCASTVFQEQARHIVAL